MVILEWRNLCAYYQLSTVQKEQLLTHYVWILNEICSHTTSTHRGTLAWQHLERCFWRTVAPTVSPDHSLDARFNEAQFCSPWDSTYFWQKRPLIWIFPFSAPGSRQPALQLGPTAGRLGERMRHQSATKFCLCSNFGCVFMSRNCRGRPPRAACPERPATRAHHAAPAGGAHCRFVPQILL